MEEDHRSGTEGTEPPKPAFGIPPLPDDLVEREAELRRLVDAGASSPEELRALAKRLREQRAAEEEAWRREVRPALMQSKKARGGLAGPRSSERDTRSIGPAVMVLVGIVVLLLIAAQTTALVLLVPVVGVLVYAYRQGREP